jgi:ATP-dependent DNA ligase
MLSKNGHRLQRFEALLDALPPGYVFDGEIVALDRNGRPRFNDLLFGRREPTYVALLFVEGEDVRALPLKERRALLEKVVRWHRLQKSEPVPEGHCLVEHANRFSALEHAEAVIRANPKQWVRILVLDGIVSMPSKSITAGPLSQGNRSAIGNLQATANSPREADVGLETA